MPKPLREPEWPFSVYVQPRDYTHKQEREVAEYYAYRWTVSDIRKFSEFAQNNARFAIDHKAKSLLANQNAILRVLRHAAYLRVFDWKMEKGY